eukprot:3125292-Amphidinium_carterae.1
MLVLAEVCIKSLDVAQHSATQLARSTVSPNCANNVLSLSDLDARNKICQKSNTQTHKQSCYQQVL